MDSLDNTRPAPPASGFHEAVFIDTATTPADTLMVVIPDFSADQPFGDPDGVVWSPMGGALPQAGDRALVAESTDGSWWVLSWWSDTQTAGVAESRVAALEAGPEAVTAVSTFANSWVNFDANRPAGYYRHAGRVYLQGMLKSGTVGAVAFTLPAGYRPAIPDAVFRGFAADSNGGMGEILIAGDGRVLPNTGSNIYFFLDGVSFRHA